MSAEPVEILELVGAAGIGGMIGWSHHAALLAGYAAALLGFEALRRAWSTPWRDQLTARFRRPWVEVGLAFLAVLAVIGIGQLYVRGFLVPERHGAVWAKCANQLLIYAPIPLLLALRRHPLSSAWLPTKWIPVRLGIGLALALLALASFHLARGTGEGFLSGVSRTFRIENADEALQVFLEDLSIAVLMVRLGAALGRGRALIIVALLFAGAHVPGMLAQGAPGVAYASLLLDAALAVTVLAILQRSADIWWFWWIHFAMDMTQFAP